jgi:hypothetical protein
MYVENAHKNGAFVYLFRNACAQLKGSSRFCF